LAEAAAITRLADLGRAGEQQVVEGQLREGGAERGVALHHQHLVGPEAAPSIRAAAR
jgi:hypothetical protein